jgi:putative hydrolase of the HAD superfamily
MVIFFDIDETLIDQRRAEAAAAHELLAEYGSLLDRPYSVEQFCRVWRAHREKHAPAFLTGLVSVHENRRRRIRETFQSSRRSPSDAEVDRIIEFYEDHYRSHWTLFDDVLPSLEALDGERCGVISNGSGEQQRLKLERTGIEGYFDVVIISENVGAAKPRRDIFDAACRAARLPAHRCIHVGDRLDHDAIASRAAGMRSLWLRRDVAQQHGDIEVINALHELGWRLQNRIAV